MLARLSLPLALFLVTSSPARADDAGPPERIYATSQIRRMPRDVKSLRLLYFHASWCRSCKRFDAGGAMDTVTKAEPDLTVQHVDVDTEVPVLERYGVEVTPTLVLVDADGFPLARPRIDLDDPSGTAERILKAVRKSTGRM
jgi:hypothetical protein